MAICSFNCVSPVSLGPSDGFLFVPSKPLEIDALFQVCKHWQKAAPGVRSSIRGPPWLFHLEGLHRSNSGASRPRDSMLFVMPLTRQTTTTPCNMECLGLMRHLRMFCGFRRKQKAVFYFWLASSSKIHLLLHVFKQLWNAGPPGQLVNKNTSGIQVTYSHGFP